MYEHVTEYPPGLESFVYVVNPPPISKVAFGSSLERTVLPKSGPDLNSFMRRMQGEILEYPGPYEYAWSKPLGKNYPSKLGFSAFASKLPRLAPLKVKDTPACGTYEIEKKQELKPSKIPLGGIGKREFMKATCSPGPAHYAIPLRWPQINVNMAFGTRRKLLPAVTVFCSVHNVSKCHSCGMTPLGDYFHNFGNKVDMCRPCMKLKLKELKSCDTDNLLRIKSKRELQNFSPVRYCGFLHDHGGTLAAIQIISNKTLYKKILVENYLYRYTQESKDAAYT